MQESLQRHDSKFNSKTASSFHTYYSWWMYSFKSKIYVRLCKPRMRWKRSHGNFPVPYYNILKRFQLPEHVIVHQNMLDYSQSPTRAVYYCFPSYKDVIWQVLRCVIELLSDIRNPVKLNETIRTANMVVHYISFNSWQFSLQWWYRSSELPSESS